MQVTYDGAHSLLIGDFVNGKYDRSGFLHTWEDLHLIPQTAPSIDPPPLKTNTIDIPGANGFIDMTEVLVGRPLYENRTGSIDFYIDSTADEYCGKFTDSDQLGPYRWDYAYDKILNTLHGFKKKVILSDARSYYYEGRVSVNSYKSDKLTGIITLDYDLEPFKASVFSMTEPWLWDPFDFVNGIIPQDLQKQFRYEMSISGLSPQFKMNNSIAGLVPQVPTITAYSNTEIDWDKSTASGAPGIAFVPFGSETTYHVNFRETDKVHSSENISIYVMTNLTAENGMLLTIGDPRPEYVFKWNYNNAFKDAEGNVVPVMFLFDFRPRRL